MSKVYKHGDKVDGTYGVYQSGRVNQRFKAPNGEIIEVSYYTCETQGHKVWCEGCEKPIPPTGLFTGLVGSCPECGRSW